MMMLRKLYWTEQSSDAYRTELELKTSGEHSAAESSTGSDRRRRNFSDLCGCHVASVVWQCLAQTLKPYTCVAWRCDLSQTVTDASAKVAHPHINQRGLINAATSLTDAVILIQHTKNNNVSTYSQQFMSGGSEKIRIVPPHKSL